MPGRLHGKVAIVTGAGTIGAGMGNGKAVALVFAQEGAAIVAVDVNAGGAETTANEIREAGGVALAIAGDVSREADVQRIVAGTIERFGRIDILHNNVGIEIPGDPVSTTEEDWDRVHDVNLKAPFLLCKHAIPHMERQGGGAIVNVSSVASEIPVGSSIAYGASKAALNMMTRSLARALGPEIRVNAVCPGYVDTAWHRNAHGDERANQIAAHYASMVPAGDFARPEDVADAIIWLIEGARQVTGETIFVDGGLHISPPR